MSDNFSLVIKNGSCYIEGNLTKVDLGLSGNMMKKIGRKSGKGMLRNLLGDLTASGNDKEDLEKILEKNPNLSRQLSSQLNQNNFSNMMENIPGFMKKK